ncbi:MAG: hypothetical protein WD875_07135 [Pirellulales bacterium]
MRLLCNRPNRLPVALAAVATVAAAILSPLATAPARACPFCTAQALTLTEEIDTSVVAVVATLVKVPDNNQQPIDPSASLTPCEFSIDQVIKGADVLGGEKVVKTLYLGQAAKGSKFLITAIPSEQSKIIWAAPIALPDRGPEYLAKVLKLPKEGPERLIFFQEYIQDKDDLLARDAYDEIARLPYKVLAAAKDKMRHDDFVKWIQDPETTASKRRMFFSLLSICGTKDDVPMIEKMIRSTDRRDRSGLDSMLNCYMSLLGEKSMPLIEELFLKDPKVDYTDRYSAIMAIRFQGTEGKAVPRERLIEALRLNLDHPKVADLVVMDLARWKDWDSMERLVEMFKKSGDETIFIREPVINYLRICPRPEAKQQLDVLAKMDPVAYQRALSMMQIPPTAAKQETAKKEDNEKGGKKSDEAAASKTAKPDAKPNGDANGGKKADDVKPTSTAPTSKTPTSKTPTSNVQPRTANRPTTAASGTLTVAVAVVATAIGGAAIALRS